MMTPELKDNPCFITTVSAPVSSLQIINVGLHTNIISMGLLKQSKFFHHDQIIVMDFGDILVTLMGFGLEKVIKPLLIDRKIQTITAYDDHEQMRDFDIWIERVSVDSELDEQLKKFNY